MFVSVFFNLNVEALIRQTQVVSNISFEPYVVEFTTLDKTGSKLFTKQ